MTPRRHAPFPVATLLTVLVAAVLSSRPVSGAVYDPAWTWRTLRTPHFRIYYHTEVEKQARELATIAEEVYSPMVATLGWEPIGPTHVTVADITDRANGFTVVLPYNQIVLYPVQPSMFSTLGDYRGWLRMLFVHEYAHVLGIDPVRGYSAVTRRVFGKVGIPLTPVGALAWFLAAPPNLFLPPWFHEGLATNLETDLTGGGRKNSTLYRMTYRVDVASDTVPPLDRLGGNFPDWASYSTRYIYGARLLELAEAEDRGPQGLGELARGHSGRFPYTIDQPPKQLTGAEYGGLYKRMRSGLEAEFRPGIERLRAAGLTPVRTVTRSGFLTTSPVWLDADRLAFTRAGPYRPTELVLHPLDGTPETVLTEAPGALTRATIVGANTLVFPRIEISRPLAGGLEYTDLYRIGIGSGTAERLTRGARLLEADFSQTADRFVAVQVVNGNQQLILLTAEGVVQRTLLAEPGVRYGTPRWSPDGSRVALSRKSDTGQARLALLDPSSGELSLLTPRGSQAGFPSWHPDGSELVFSWDRSGVFDLYRYHLADGSLSRLTRLLGGAFEPDWSPDGERIAFTSYGSAGYDVAILELADTLDEPVPDTDLSPPESLRGPLLPAKREALEAEPYSAWPRIRPGFWLPDLLADNQGVALGAWTAGHDPLFRHKYFLSGFWAGKNRRFYGRALYLNDVSYPTVTLDLYQLPVLHAGLFATDTGDVDYWEQERRAGVSARLRYPQSLTAWSFAVGWAWQEVSRLSRTAEDLGGRPDLADAPFQGRLNPLTLSVLFDSAFPYTTRFTVGAEGGRRVEGIYRLRSELTGAELDRQELSGSWREYLPLAPEKHRTLALSLGGGTSWGDDTAQSAFQIGGVDTLLPLRGYPSRVARGDTAVVGSAEFRLPLWQLYRGLRDLPLFLSRLDGAAFFDSGRTWGGEDNAWRNGAGLEASTATVLGYYLPTTAVVGWAHGFGDDGESQLYFTFRGGL